MNDAVANEKNIASTFVDRPLLSNRAGWHTIQTPLQLALSGFNTTSIFKGGATSRCRRQLRYTAASCSALASVCETLHVGFERSLAAVYRLGLPSTHKFKSKLRVDTCRCRTASCRLSLHVLHVG